MNKLFKIAFRHHKDFWTKSRILGLVTSLAFFGLALIVQKLADFYVGILHGAVVPDLILDILPTVDIDVVIVQGALLLTLVIVLLLLVKPKYIMFTLKALAIFIITRSFFISLTHLGISPRQLTFDTHSFGFGIYNWMFNTTGDFFFSGHTGTPYLMALIFWKEKWWRYFFLCVSFVFALSVLLAHIHYSIDVFAAPFMTYGIFIITKTLFPKDYKVIDPPAPQ